MSLASPVACRSSVGVVRANALVSTDLLRLDIELDVELGFTPGQFAMLNLAGPAVFVFSRPFSILAVDGPVVSFLYRVVGRGTRALADLGPENLTTVLGPLGTPFPGPTTEAPAVMLAGGVGLPPLLAWWHAHAGARDLAFFGARHGGDVPWSLLPDRWQVSVDRHRDVPPGRKAFTGLVTELAGEQLADAESGPRVLLACGPLPLLTACARWARKTGWTCYVSLEEHMGCGYGACKGCVVPVHATTTTRGAAANDDWRNATCCQEGPVFSADQIDWRRLTGADFPAV